MTVDRTWTLFVRLWREIAQAMRGPWIPPADGSGW
jgi:hypothetical protein